MFFGDCWCWARGLSVKEELPENYDVTQRSGCVARLPTLFLLFAGLVIDFCTSEGNSMYIRIRTLQVALIRTRVVFIEECL